MTFHSKSIYINGYQAVGSAGPYMVPTTVLQEIYVVTGAGVLTEVMKDIEIVQPMVTIRSRMKQADIPALEALAEAMLKN